MADDNLFEDLKEALTDFESFLATNVPTIKPAIETIAGFIPQVNELIDLLIDLMGKIKKEVENLDLGAIQEQLAKVGEFGTNIKSFLDAARTLLPDESATIDTIASTTDIVTSLPSFDEVKAELIRLIDAIVSHLNSLKS